eukprot:336305-Pyramimonas_sp.AAC.2
MERTTKNGEVTGVTECSYRPSQRISSTKVVYPEAAGGSLWSSEFKASGGGFEASEGGFRPRGCSLVNRPREA